MSGDIGFLASFAYGNGTDPIDYATEHVIETHVNVFLTVMAARVTDAGAFPGYPPLSTAVLARRILGDLMDAGWVPPEVAP